ncbi:MAG TPA: AAA family ATPase [Saprospiraceae bacterium]|nr:AAA family ATPase [Saprospiraceae bacterium]
MDQSKALQIMKSGRNVFLTGSAGTGKTYTLNKYIDWLRMHKVPVAKTASTGIAATHMNGTTIHSWSGIGVKDFISRMGLLKLKDKKYLTKNTQNTHVLIIDEISMLHRKQLDLVNEVLKYLRQSTAPFGGMQVIFAGDFFQLPPVTNSPQYSRDKMAFMSEAWAETQPVVCYLDKQFRQDENELTSILNQIRRQEVPYESYERLMKTADKKFSIEPTKLYTHNADVDRINAQELKKLDGEEHQFEAKTSGNKKMLEGFVKSLLVPGTLKLKKGAKVMFLKNNHEIGVMNGTIGRIKGFHEDEDGKILPIVQLMNGRTIEVEPELWSIDNEKGGRLVSLKQIPLRLAWAMTIHKSQGMTLEAAEIDLSKTFEAGQGYVALSRLRNLEGLRLLGMNDKSLLLDALALKADKRFRELSEEAGQLAEKALEKQFETHILKRGGTTDQKEIKKQKHKRIAKKKKLNTYQLTAQLIEKRLSLEEIAKERGLAMSTLQGHILRISKDHPEVDITYLKPEDGIFDKVAAAYKICLEKAGEDEFSKDGKLRSKLVFDQLKGQFDYGTIKLCYAFLE